MSEKAEYMETAQAKPQQEIQYPPYPSDHSEEAHQRAKYIQDEISMLDDNHYRYMEKYNQRRAELELILEMAHAAIERFDRATMPETPMPMSHPVQQVPGRRHQDPGPTARDQGQRTPYDTGIRPPGV